MTLFVILLVFLVAWIVLVTFAKQEAKSLLSKYGFPLPWSRSNSIILMVHRLQELKEKGIFEEKEELGECKFIVFVLKGSLIMFPLVMLLVFVAAIMVID